MTETDITLILAELEQATERELAYRSTEDQGAQDAANLEAVKEWIH